LLINSNGIQDSGEPSCCKEDYRTNTGRFTFTDQNGNYSVVVLDSGNFTVSPQSLNGIILLLITPQPSPEINQTDSLNDFAFQPQGTFEDVCITITPLGNFRSGFNAFYHD
jgi:hypothetical protein